jgi:hypothetical protein
MVEAAEGQTREFLAHAPLFVIDLRFELSPFLFIYIMA